MPYPFHVYRPQQTPSEALEAIFVGREAFLQDILAQLKRWRPGASRQHLLIIGPRGIGKTHLLRLLRHRTNTQAELKNKWYPIQLAEEIYGVTRVTDLLIETLRILTEETQDSNLESVYDQVKFDDDEKRVTDLTLDGFRRYYAATGRGILMMIENVNRVFERQIKKRSEIHLLRKILIEEDWLTLICTSPTYLNAVLKENEPLFEFFSVRLLEELSFVNQQELLFKLAALEDDVIFEQRLRKSRSKLEALYHFTGGNPRLTILLYDLVAKQNVTEVKSNLDFLLDQLTPFYQDRMKEISEQEGKLLETMALMHEGCSPTDLAASSRMPAKHVRALLARMEKAGYVRREQRRQKRTIYILPERFFRIWHQMNHSRAVRGRMQYLLEFFSAWYTDKLERDQAWDELKAAFEHGRQSDDERRVRDISEYMTYVADISEGAEKHQRHFDRLRMTSDQTDEKELLYEIAFLDAENSEDGDYFEQKGLYLSQIPGRYEDALQAFTRACDLSPGEVSPWFNRGVALDKLGHKYKANQAYDCALSLLNRTSEDDDAEKYGSMHAKTPRVSDDFHAPRFAGDLLGRTRDSVSVEVIITSLENALDKRRRQFCAVMLGRVRSHKAVPALLKLLRDRTSSVRSSAATALGKIGSEQVVAPLIASLQDETSNVRGSAAIALGKLASDHSIPEFETITASVLENISLIRKDRSELLQQSVLRSAFLSGSVETVQRTIDTIVSRFANGEMLSQPHATALEYLQSDRDPAVLERQHPEMREAMLLLVDLFDRHRGES